uniref:Uncharacterized protein n=1 Tax=Nelumbo nucifera TaxID=4432 RepID=A0A822ZHG9_NELNU|nr:TPA_asm: hypothetical protein HUJ06_001105 [Nelumbo nucifera]
MSTCFLALNKTINEIAYEIDDYVCTHLNVHL